MHEGIASKLVDRLVNGGILTAEQRTAFMDAFVDAPDPFFDKENRRSQLGKLSPAFSTGFTCTRCQLTNRLACLLCSISLMTLSVARRSTPRAV